MQSTDRSDHRLDDQSANKCKFFVKKSHSKRQIRQNKRQESEDESSEDESVVVNSGRKAISNGLIQSTNSFNKLKRKKNFEVSNDKGSDEESTEQSIGISYSSKRSAQREGPEDMGATSIVQTETDKAVDAQTIFEKAQEINERLKGKEDDKIYRGLNNYVQYRTKKDTPQGNASSGFVRKGPIRAPDNIRSTVRWDYQPDLCKDYKETGFCGFGESCIFLHDRTDYKSGWQLELEAQNKDNAEDLDQYVIKDDDDLPFKCFICRESFQSPVVTKCKHYFCEKCAIDHFKKTSRCFVCNQQTGGVFNIAKDVIKKFKQNETIDTQSRPNDHIPDEDDSESDQ